ncbi:HAD family phosphatase [Flaviaesturariibacter amylovorans]|uniref:HAD-IA family hydrolase n=1 Tax=Flaviaesturariibacter amylovorans TaxID=1084520 RepID=A0ABP8HUY8_9BACT
MKPDTIIWDLGNVLVDWNPRYLFNKLFTNKEEQDHFLAHVCTDEWHRRQDGGRPVAEATGELAQQHPGLAHYIRAFYARWKEMFGGPITGSVALLAELKDRGYRQYALTNWSAELFDETRPDYPFLEWFDGIVVSGAERMTKPDADIYHVLLERYSVDPARAVFIDDREANVRTALQLGLHGIVFSTPDALRNELRKLDIL